MPLLQHNVNNNMESKDDGKSPAILRKTSNTISARSLGGQVTIGRQS
jgi:hypothetical protein